MAWYEEFFGEDYLRLYSRLDAYAQRETKGIEEMLLLPPKARILDLCCGDGRIAIELARKGYIVAGYDLSPYMLERAQAAARQAGIDMPFRLGDMRQLPYEAEFDAVISILTSFGYFDTEEEDIKVVRGVARALKPKGKFLLDAINRDYLVRNQQPKDWHLGEGLIMLEERKFDPVTGRLHGRLSFIGNNGERREYDISIRLYTVPEISRMLEQVGLVLTAVFGDFDLSPFGFDSHRMIAMGEKR